jgi:hypothetical protein
MPLGIELTARERPVAIFTFVYVIGFSAWFILQGNTEFVVYLVTMLILIALVGRSLRSAEYPTAMLWALSLWGLLHMAGGGVPVGGAVLYNLQVIPLGPNRTGSGRSSSTTRSCTPTASGSRPGCSGT